MAAWGAPSEYTREVRRRVAKRLPAAVVFLLANAALATAFEVLRFPERARWMFSFDAAMLVLSGVILAYARLRPQHVVGATVLAMNAVGLLLNLYHAVVDAEIAPCVWTLTALQASSVVFLPLGPRAVALGSIGTVLGYPLMLQTGDAQPLAWAAGGAYLAMVVGMSVAGAALISRYLKIDLSLSRALSEREARLEELLAREQAARRRAEAASRAKDEFLATISHELRTPLTPILGWTRQLRDGLLNPAEVEQAVRTIERSGSSLAQLIEDLLDVSRITQGKLRLSLRSVDVSAVVSAAIEPMRPAAEAKEIQLHVLLAKESPIVSADPDRLQQIVWNLVSNAIKFTPRGGNVRVAVRRTSLHAEIVVADTGHGIAPDVLPHVFERFWQADGSSTRAHGGLGLGLAIVRHLVELHGGNVRAESSGEGQGAIFHVQLPATTGATRAAEATPRRTGGSLAGVSVLIVDDEDDGREMVRNLFERRGVEVRTASSARQALEVLDLWNPRVLISDIAMPQQDGISLIRAVRAREADLGGHLPALAFTARSRREDRAEALAAGYDGYLAKPSDPDELLSLVASLADGNAQSLSGY